MRRSVPVLFVVSLIVNVGMWLERFVIVVISLHRDYLPSAWRMYYPTVWDFTHLVGSIGLFLTLLFLFIRVLPMISIFELRDLVHETGGGASTWPRLRKPHELYGLLAEFDRRGGLARGGPPGVRRRLSKNERLYAVAGRRIVRGAGAEADAAAARGAVGRLLGGMRGVLHDVLRVGHQLPDQRRRPATAQLARVHPDHIRTDRARGVVRRVLRNAGPQRPAASAPSAVQRAGVQPGQPRPFLSVHSAARPAFQLDQTRQFLEWLRGTVHEVEP